MLGWSRGVLGWSWGALGWSQSARVVPGCSGVCSAPGEVRGSLGTRVPPCCSRSFPRAQKLCCLTPPPTGDSIKGTGTGTGTDRHRALKMSGGGEYSQPALCQRLRHRLPRDMQEAERQEYKSLSLAAVPGAGCPPPCTRHPPTAPPRPSPAFWGREMGDAGEILPRAGSDGTTGTGSTGAWGHRRPHGAPQPPHRAPPGGVC